jgi:hypothetical protein
LAEYAARSSEQITPVKTPPGNDRRALFSASSHPANRRIDGILFVQHQWIARHHVCDAQLSQIASSGELSAHNVTVGKDPDNDRAIRWGGSHHNGADALSAHQPRSLDDWSGRTDAHHRSLAQIDHFHWQPRESWLFDTAA